MLSCLYVLFSLVFTVLHLRLSDRNGVGALLIDLIWLSLAVAVVDGVWRCRILTRSSRALDTNTDCDQSGAAADATPSHALPNRSSQARKRGFRLPEAVGFLALLAVYHGVFLPGAITWGDWSYYINAGAVRRMFPIPSLWSSANLGKQNILGLPLAPVETLMGLTARIGIPYSMIERIFFYIPGAVLPYLGVVALLRALGARPGPSTLAGFVFAANPYALALIAGGQVTVGMGYALAPWVALVGLHLYRRGGLGRGALVGLLVGIQAWYDPREALLSCMAASVVIAIVAVVYGRQALGRTRVRDLVAAVSVLLASQLHWVLVATFAVQPALPSGYTAISWLRALSYMSLGDGLTIFHPFWPFYAPRAVVHAVPAIWLVLPAVVAVALLYRPQSLSVISAGAVYLVFAALVSGSTPPFGAVNAWLFAHMPGLDLFRDPSPYFGPGALAAAVLIGLGLARANASVTPTTALGMPARGEWHALLYGVAGVMLVGMSIVGSFPAASGRLRYNLAPRKVPGYDVALASYLKRHSSGSVLWLPYTSRFAAKRAENPTLSGWTLSQMSGVFFPHAGVPFSWLAHPDLVGRVLQRYGVRYVVLDASRPAYRSLSVPYGQTVRMERAAFSGLEHRSFGPLTLYRVPSAPEAPFSLTDIGQVVSRQPAALQPRLSGFPLSVSSQGGVIEGAGAAGAFPVELGKVSPSHRPGTTSSPTSRYLSLAEPLQPYSVVQLELQGNTMFLRDIPTVAGGRTPTELLAAAPYVRWQPAGSMSQTDIQRGIVVRVGGINRYLSGSALAGKQPMAVASVPTDGSSLTISVERLGGNLLGPQSFVHGLDGWSGLGNEDNSNHLPTLLSAGISATAGGACGSGTLALSARRDAAGISHAVSPTPTNPLVVGGQVRSLMGSPPLINGFFAQGKELQLSAPTSNGRSWSPVSTLVTGRLTGLQLLVYAGRHGGSVACLRDPYVREAVPGNVIRLKTHTNLVLRQGGRSTYRGPVTYQPAPGLHKNLELLPTTTFTNGLGAWGAPGDANNYDHDSLAAAGITAGVTRQDGKTVLRMTVRRGAAAINEHYSTWASSNTYRLSLTYRTSPGASLAVQFFQRPGGSPAGYFAFASSDGQWVTKTVEFYMSSATSTLTVPVGNLELILWPGGSRNGTLAYIRQVSLRQVVPGPVIIGRLTPPYAADRRGIITPKWLSAPAGGNRYTIIVAPHSMPQLLVFWQSYSKGWEAVDSRGAVLRHVIVNGWANGFVVGEASAALHVQLVYQPQQWEDIGLLVELLACIVVAVTLSLLVMSACRRRRHRRNSIPA